LPLDNDEVYPRLRAAWSKIKNRIYNTLQTFGAVFSLKYRFWLPIVIFWTITGQLWSSG
jgi:hypothetical protein